MERHEMLAQLKVLKLHGMIAAFDEEPRPPIDRRTPSASNPETYAALVSFTCKSLVWFR
jgi:hypothetical protein